MPKSDALPDDELRLIFTCCHPALPPDARVALTLREVGGLTTEEVASAYLAKPAAIAQWIVRAKARIRDERIPYEVPPGRICPSASAASFTCSTSSSTRATPRQAGPA